jgi:sugar-specific transcriptional regulator TrmB
MLFDVKTISQLQKLGLTLYGAKTYVALVSTGPTTATVLADEAEVPRSKIYETLKRLEEEKWVIAERGRPITYTPRYPKEVIDEKRSSLYYDLDEVSNQLTMTYDRLMEQENPKVWLIRGYDNIISKSTEMIDRAKQEVMMMGALYSPQEIEPLKKHILMAKKRGVNVRIITRPTIKSSSGDVEIIKSLLPVTTDIKASRSPYIKNVIIDHRELLVEYSHVEGGVTDLENVVAIWISNTSVASYMASNFNLMWDTLGTADHQ